MEEINNRDGVDVDSKKKKSPFVKWMLRVAAVLVVGLVAFSIYVANHVTDPQDTVIFGQTSLYADNSAAMRILVRNYKSGEPIPGATVLVKLESENEAYDLGEFITGDDGCISNAIYVPDVAPGKYTLVVKSKSGVGSDVIERQIEVKRPYRLYVTTDKPVYQPGQTIHMRGMVLNRVSLKPFGGQDAVFEIEDPKGNKVHRATVKTSEYGIVSTDFDIASEVNLGRYRIRAIIGDVESEKIVTVKHYVLPKFKIDISTDKTYYLPNERVSGVVQSRYFFGKPVAGAMVEIVGKTIIEKPTEVFRFNGQTDAKGEMAFDGQLGDYFTGMPLAGGNAFLQIEVAVTDAAGHRETSTKQSVVARQSINIHAVPESGELVTSVENIIYMMTAYPDGAPAECQLNVNGKLLVTDKTGIAVFTIVPKTESVTLGISARDKAGRTGRLEREVGLSPSNQTFLLRTDRAVYSGGQSVRATLLSTEPERTIFLDIIKDKQTILTKTLVTKNGRGGLVIDLPAGVFGTLKLNAYTITGYGQSISDTRVIHVQQAKQLHVETSLDKPVYRPGEMAHVNFTVTDLQGKPAQAALGLSVVDEAVFYVSENRPGLLEQFFLVDEEMMQPAYQIKFAVSPARLFKGSDEDQQLAQALFAATVQSVDKPLDLDYLEEYIGRRMLENLQEYKDEGRLDKLLESPRYAHLADLLNVESVYTLRTMTYRDKVREDKEFREKYFDLVENIIIGLFIVCIGLGVIVVVVRSIRNVGEFLPIGDLDEVQIVVQRSANGIRLFFVYLFFLPFISYMGSGLLTVFLFRSDIDEVLVFVFAANVFITFVLLIMQINWSLEISKYPQSAKYTKKLLCFPIIFLVQYICSRTAIILTINDVIDDDYIVAIIVATFLISLYAYLHGSSVAKDMAIEFHVRLKRTGASVLVGTIFIALFIGAIMMPALSKAKEMAKGVQVSSEINAFDKAIYMYNEDHPSTDKVQKNDQPVRVRKYFPETLLWQPELITDERGRASLAMAMADSITTWRMSIDAVSAAGSLGSSEVGVRVFQDFFVDLDLPVALTRNDEISLPILCYNYLDKPQKVKLSLKAGGWYELQGDGQREVELGAGEVRSVMMRIKARDVGSHRLTLMAQGERLSDAVERVVTVRPDGREIENLQNGILNRSAAHVFTVGTDAIENSESLVLNLYPSTFSEVVEGLDNIFRMPGGCFEQTSSTTYPNIMALQYMQRTKQVTPEVEIKARKFITAGYQRLLTFEVDGGGFDWYGSAPADESLTAYGIMEFTDMSKVHHVDQAVIERAKKWLLSKQKSDGSWRPNRRVYSLGGVRGDVMTTAYIAWTLAEAGQKGREMQAALNYLRKHSGEKGQAYAMALTANALLAYNKDDSFGKELVSRLNSRFVDHGKTASLSSSGSGAMHSRGQCLEVETTSLAALAMMKAGRYPQTVKKALMWLSQQKDQFGTWHSTQSTVLAMKALIAGTGGVLGSDINLDIEVGVNGQVVDRVNITPEKSDLLRMVSLTRYLKPGRNDIRIVSSEDAEINYRLVGSYWVTGEPEALDVPKELEILVNYDKASLAVDDVLTCHVEVRRNGQTPVNMAIIDLAIPPGFMVDRSAFERLVKIGQLAKYELTGNQCILYLRDIKPGEPIQFKYQLRALYPIRAKIPPAEVYEYYRPENRDRSLYYDIEVVKELI
ncbi:MAG: hypothetical protein K9M57_03295 [Phycisphaerae bacterium]|nr:hypothetical protein [Phycisphaerae bacterium]